MPKADRALGRLQESLRSVGQALYDVERLAAERADWDDPLEDIRYLIGLLADAAPDDTQVPVSSVKLIGHAVRTYREPSPQRQHQREHFVPLVDARPPEESGG